jgi:cell division protease FtsH
LPRLDEEKRMTRVVKQLLIWAVVIACLLALNLYLGKSSAGAKQQKISYAEMLGRVQSGSIKDVTIEGTTLTGHYAGGGQFRTTIPPHAEGMFATFREHKVNITVRDQQPNRWVSMLISLAPFPLLLGLPFLVVLVFLLLARRRRTGPPANA